MSKKKGKRKKARVALRKNWQRRARRRDWRLRGEEGEEHADELRAEERVYGKGELTRHRTVFHEERGAAEGGEPPRLAVDEKECLQGRVLRVHGAGCAVQGQDGRAYHCAVRRLLKTLATDQRNVVTVGDRVLFRPAPGDEGMIERVEPRRGVLTRASRGRKHVIVANVDQLLVVSSAAEPRLKPNLIDRYLISAEQGGVEPIIVINKVDLVEPAGLAHIVGLYSQLGYRVLVTSAVTGLGIEALRALLCGRETAVCGQSGVGKSSLLNAVQPELGLRIAAVSAETEKGRHTTSTAELIELDMGGWVVDTPGVRQYELWDIIPEEVEGYFIEFRPLVAFCRFPDCSHIHEEGCAVKRAVLQGLIHASRYDHYVQIFQGEPAA